MLTVEVTGVTDPTRRVLHARGDLKVNVSRIVNGLGVGTGAVSLSIPLNRADRDRIEDARLTYRRLWWILDDDEPIFVAMPTEHPQWDPRKNSLTGTFSRADRILDRRRFWHTLVFRGVDQHHIGGDLVRYGSGRPTEHVAAQYAPHVGLLPGGFLPWLRISESASGVTRTVEDNDRGYQGIVGKQVSVALRELADSADTNEPGTRKALGLPGAFDVALEYGRDPDGKLFAEYVFGYPKIGRDDPLYVAYPGPIKNFVESVDDAETVTGWRTIPEGTEARLPGEPWYDTDAFAAGWPLLQGQDSMTSINPDELRDHAAAMGEKYRGENRGWRFDLDVSEWGKFGLGDIVRPAVRFEDRWAGVQNLPPQRITGYELGYSGNVLSSLSPVLAATR